MAEKRTDIMKKISFKKQTVEISALIFLYSSVLIFCFSWLNIFAALLCSAAFAVGFAEFLKRRKHCAEDVIQIGTVPFCLIIVFFTAVCICSGIGGFVYQSGDWDKHNAVLRDLINYSWPVYYENGSVMLTYYIAGYLIPAIIGKIFGVLKLAEIAELLWSVAGLVIFFLYACFITNAKSIKRQLAVSYFSIFFCTLSLLSELIISFIYPELPTINTDGSIWNPVIGVMLCQTGTSVGLQYCFSQTIPILLCTTLLFENKRFLSDYVFLLFPLMLYSVVSFTCLSIFAIVYAFCCVFSDREKAKRIKSLFSLSNLFGIVPCFFTMLYYLGNIKSKKPANTAFCISVLAEKRYLPVALIFIVVSLSVPLLFTARSNKRDSFYWITIAFLCILPFFKMGLYNDLNLRFTQNLVCILMLYFLIELFGKNAKKEIKTIVLSVIIFFSLFRFVFCFSYSTYFFDERQPNLERDTYYSMSEFACENAQNNLERADFNALISNYYTRDANNDFFVKHIARRKNSSYNSKVERVNNDKLYIFGNQYELRYGETNENSQ